MIELAPSILSADFARLGAEAQAAVEGGATVLHVDVMDGHFVPNIKRPDEFIPAFADAGADWISVHQEACVHLDRTLHLIAAHGCKPGVVINPATPVHALDEVLPLVHHVLVMSVNPGFGGQTFIHSSLKKIELLSNIRESRRLGFRIEVDGGIHHDTVAQVVRAGAEILVAGSAIFEQGNPSENARHLLKSALDAAATVQDFPSVVGGSPAAGGANSLSLP
jgi:ribulose-phosphate 3-epimerase